MFLNRISFKICKMLSHSLYIVSTKDPPPPETKYNV